MDGNEQNNATSEENNSSAQEDQSPQDGWPSSSSQNVSIWVKSHGEWH